MSQPAPNSPVVPSLDDVKAILVRNLPALARWDAYRDYMVLSVDSAKAFATAIVIARNLPHQAWKNVHRLAVTALALVPSPNNNVFIDETPKSQQGPDEWRHLRFVIDNAIVIFQQIIRWMSDNAIDATPGRKTKRAVEAPAPPVASVSAPRAATSMREEPAATAPENPASLPAATERPEKRRRVEEESPSPPASQPQPLSPPQSQPRAPLASGQARNAVVAALGTRRTRLRRAQAFVDYSKAGVPAPKTTYVAELGPVVQGDPKLAVFPEAFTDFLGFGHFARVRAQPAPAVPAVLVIHSHPRKVIIKITNAKTLAEAKTTLEDFLSDYKDTKTPTWIEWYRRDRC